MRAHNTGAGALHFDARFDRGNRPVIRNRSKKVGKTLTRNTANPKHRAGNSVIMKYLPSTSQHPKAYPLAFEIDLQHGLGRLVKNLIFHLRFSIEAVV